MRQEVGEMSEKRYHFEWHCDFLGCENAEMLTTNPNNLFSQKEIFSLRISFLL